MKVSIVIPAYNEAENIGSLLDELRGNLAFKDDGVEVAIIVVDDASSDATYEKVLQRGYKDVTVLRLSRRSGSHVALRAGLKRTQGDVAICMAADGQDDPAVIAKMIDQWRAGNEIVWAVRESRERESWFYQVFAAVFYRLLKFFAQASASIDLSRADFFLLDKKVVQAINSCLERNTSLLGLILWVGFNQTSVEYKRRARREGMSKWSFRSRLALAKDWVIAFSGIPLKLLTVIGFIIAFLGFSYAVLIILLNIIFGNPVQGWSSVMTAILLLGGVQMMMIGVIGEYLWKTLDESRDRPLYFIEKEETMRTSKTNRS